MNPINNPFITLAIRAANEEWDEQQVRQELVFFRKTGLTSRELGHELTNAIQAIANPEWSGQVVARIDGLISTFMAKVDQKTCGPLYLELTKAWLLRALAGDTAATLPGRVHCEAARSLILSTSPNYPTLQYFEGLLTALEANTLYSEIDGPLTVQRAQKLLKVWIQSTNRQSFIREHLNKFDDSVLSVLRQMGQAARQLGQNEFPDRMEKLIMVISKLRPDPALRAQKLLQALTQSANQRLFVRKHLNEFDDSVLSVLRHKAEAARKIGQNKFADFITALIIMVHKLRLDPALRAQKLFEALMQSGNPDAFMLEHLDKFDDSVLSVLRQMGQTAQSQDQEFANQINTLIVAIGQLRDNPPALRAQKLFKALMQSANPNAFIFEHLDEFDDSVLEALRQMAPAMRKLGQNEWANQIEKLIVVISQLQNNPPPLRVQKLLQALMQSANPDTFIFEHFDEFDDSVLEVLQQMAQAARKNGQDEFANRMEAFIMAIDQLPDNPPALRAMNLFKALMESDNRQRFVREHLDEFDDSVLSVLREMAQAARKDGQAEFADQIEALIVTIGKRRFSKRIQKLFKALTQSANPVYIREYLDEFDDSVLSVLRQDAKRARMQGNKKSADMIEGFLVTLDGLRLSVDQQINLENHPLLHLAHRVQSSELTLVQAFEEALQPAILTAVDQPMLYVLNRHVKALADQNHSLAFTLARLNNYLASHIAGPFVQAECALSVGKFGLRNGQEVLAQERLAYALRLYSELDNLAGQADTYFESGKVLVFLHKYSEALESYHKALQLYKKVDLLVGQAHTHRDIGEVLFFLYKHSEALEEYNKALLLYKKVDLLVGQAATHLGFGNVLFFLKKHSEALEQYNKALSLYEKEGHLMGQATTHVKTGEVLSFLGRHSEALEQYNKGLLIYEKEGHLVGQATTHRLIGEVLFFLHKHSEALERYNKALLLAEKERNFVTHSDTYFRIGELLSFLRRHSEALEQYNRALPLYEKEQNLLGQANIHRATGDVLAFLNKHSEALERYNKALLLAEKVGENIVIVNTHVMIGELLLFSNKPSEALSHYETAQPLAEKAGDVVGQANIHCAIGRVLSFLKKYSEALSHYETALPFYKETSQLVGQAYTHLMIGEMLFSLNKPSVALSHYETALPLAEEASDYAAQANIHVAIGQVFFSLNKPSEALSHYETALPLAEKASDYVTQASAHLASGEVLLSLNKPSEALSRGEMALSLYEEAGYVVGQARTHLMIGQGLFSLNKPSEALSRSEMALSLSEEAGELTGQINSNGTLGRLWWQQKQYERAYDAFMRSLEKMDSMRHLQQREEWRRSITVKGMKLYREMVALCLEMERPLEAWHWAERNKGRSLLELLSSTRPRLDTSEKRAAYSQWLRLEREVFSLEQLLHQSDSHHHRHAWGAVNRHYLTGSIVSMLSKEQMTKLVAELKDLQEKEAQAREKLLAVLDEGREFIAVEVPEAPELAHILRDLTLGSLSDPANSETSRRPLLVEYFTLSPDHYAVFLLPLWRVGSTEALPLLVQQTKLPLGTGRQVLQHFFKSYNAVRQGMITSRADVPPEATSQTEAQQQQAAQTALELFATLPEKLSQAFLQPWWEEALQQLANLIPEEEQRIPTELILVPHGPLHLLPLHAASLADGTLLIEQYPLVYLPNATIASTLLKRRQTGNKPTKRLVMGPPGRLVEENGQEVLKPDPPLALVETQELAEDWGLTEEGQPYALSEMKIDVLQQYASQWRGQWEWLHLATHSTFDFEDYLQSHIHFHNERLTLTQLISDETLDFRGLRLCYLSSCESGMARPEAGDELQGLVWALTYAGAEAVMASLWPVNDEAGYLMSTLFYNYWEEEGSLMTAYRQALLDIRDEPGFDNPYYWAPFVLFGNGF